MPSYLCNQAEFARLKRTSRKTVTAWKRDGRLVMVGGLVDIEASQEKLRRGASYRAVKQRGPVTSDPVAVYDHPADYGNPANLPDVVVSISTAVGGGASDLGIILLRHLPLDLVKTIVAEWTQQQRDGWVGGPGLPASVADDEWPKPPVGYARWSDHPIFEISALLPDSREWEGLQTIAAGLRP